MSRLFQITVKLRFKEVKKVQFMTHDCLVPKQSEMLGQNLQFRKQHSDI